MLRHVVAGPTTVGELAGGVDPHLAMSPGGACLLWTHWWVLLSCVCAQLCLTLCDPMDCIPQGSSVHGISQARILEWVPISSFPLDPSGIFLTQGLNTHLLHLLYWQMDSLPLHHLGSLDVGGSWS